MIEPTTIKLRVSVCAEDGEVIEWKSLDLLVFPNFRRADINRAIQATAEEGSSIIRDALRVLVARAEKGSEGQISCKPICCVPL